MALRMRSQLNAEEIRPLPIIGGSRSHCQHGDGRSEIRHLRVIGANERNKKAPRHYVSNDGVRSIRSDGCSSVHQIGRCLEIVQHDEGTAKDLKVNKSACEDFGQILSCMKGGRSTIFISPLCEPEPRAVVELEEIAQNWEPLWTWR